MQARHSKKSGTGRQSSHLVLTVSVLLGMAFWFMEAAIHVFIFHEGPYVKQLFFPEKHEIWMRSFGVFLIAAFGAYAQFMITKHKRAECKIKSAHGELDQIFNTAADGMRLIDKNFNIIKINDTFARFTGVNRDEAVGKKCYEIFSGPMCHTSQCSLCQILSGNERIEYVVQKKRRDGLVIPCILTATPFRGIKDELVGIVEDFKDITEHKKAAESLEQLNIELTDSNKKLKTLVLIDPHTGLYNYRYLGEAIEAEFCRAKREGLMLSVVMMDIDYFKSINDVYGHQFGDLVLKQVAEQLKQVVRRYDIVIRFGGEEFIVISPNTDKSAALILGQRLLNAVSSSDFGNKKQTVKIRLSGAVSSYPESYVAKGMALVDLADKILNKAKEDGGNRIYSSLDLTKLKVSSVKENNSPPKVKLLKSKIDKLTKRANQSLIEAIFAFAKTIELKDHYTGEHVEKTVYYATETAKALNLPKDEIECIGEAARLHDLGKIGIGEKILLKPAPLTAEEFEEIKKHPQIGVDIIQSIQSLHDIVPLILYHQEKWDGSGYPAGLKGEEIPMGARVISIADVYQALTSDRPYRKAYSKEDATKMIENNSNSQFDPAIVKVFLNILQQENKNPAQSEV